uniref:mRNA decay activator protein ZFP36 n=1 Tax=Reithrodontomys fulvescens TaxID=56213 RepID=A0A0S1FML4_REIFU|nr:zinc finger protein 36 C3H type-like 3 [Reithrodontomys fulvescens]
MTTLLWTFYSMDFMRRNQMPSYLNGRLHTNGAPSSSSFMPGFIPPPSSSNPQVLHLAPRAFSCPSNFPTGAKSRGNGQLGTSGGAALREPSGAYAVRQFHPENSQHSLQQRPPQQQKASSSSSAVTSGRYKTELCRPFEESGICRYGHKCQFAHGSRELRTLLRHPKYKTEPCRTFHSSGFCPYGTRCHFIHNQSSQQPVLFQSPSGELRSAGDFSGGEPEPRLPTGSSVSSSGLPSGQSQPLEEPLLLDHQMLSSGPVPHFGPQLPDAQSETPELDMLTSSLDSLLGISNFDNLMNYSPGSSSLSGSATPRSNPSRRLPIFSSLSDSDK